ncbi:hypothetical protein LshimejAT787_1600160 [Lyophyllum shimeji]|uniref:Uncharacterized protein n=1 Tax=Lyophyllum shimeji TaxID=47721 RepID=A0A9P3PZQ9_LYOSH|nr:hypothetical protein LshimejAT787_1600160 [Lyophyllum shimeji]
MQLKSGAELTAVAHNTVEADDASQTSPLPPLNPSGPTSTNARVSVDSHACLRDGSPATAPASPAAAPASPAAAPASPAAGAQAIYRMKPSLRPAPGYDTSKCFFIYFHSLMLIP